MLKEEFSFNPKNYIFIDIVLNLCLPLAKETQGSLEILLYASISLYSYEAIKLTSLYLL